MGGQPLANPKRYRDKGFRGLGLRCLGLGTDLGFQGLGF